MGIKSDLVDIDLRNACALRLSIDCIAHDIEHLESAAYNITSHMRTDGTPPSHGGPPDKMAEAVARLQVQRDKLARKSLEYADTMTRVVSRLDAMRSDQRGIRYARLLHMRYIDDLAWADIAPHFAVEVASIYKLHRDALKAYAAAGGEYRAQ